MEKVAFVNGPYVNLTPLPRGRKMILSGQWFLASARKPSILKEPVMSFQICIKTDKPLQQLVTEIRDLLCLPPFRQNFFADSSYFQFELLGMLVLIHEAEEEEREPEVSQTLTASTCKCPLPTMNWTPTIWSTACSPTTRNCSASSLMWRPLFMRSRRWGVAGRFAIGSSARIRNGTAPSSTGNPAGPRRFSSCPPAPGAA